jgi:SAM-dependent methyltransferase
MIGTVERRCRSCGAALHTTFVNLNHSPLANSLLHRDALDEMESFYPLHAFVCDQCFLVQLDLFEPPERIFGRYLYFSSFADTWLKHAKHYCDQMRKRFDINQSSRVVEIGSNDGYLLRNFVEAGIPVIGVEPAANVAAVAESRGVPTKVAFFGASEAEALRSCGYAADLMCANNVLAHVPDIHDFVEGFRILLKPGGVATFEFPHLLRLIEANQFDTIYHEHFSYFSLLSAEQIFAAHELTIFDIEELPTHGGSLRIYVCLIGERPTGDRVGNIRSAEHQAGLGRLESYTSFSQQIVRTKCDLLEFLIDAKRAGQCVVGYGAPAKGNTLLNYCGVGREFIEFTTDRNPHKQGLFLPGTHIPILHPDAIFEARPNYILVLPWNLKDEIIDQMGNVRSFGARFVTAIPHLEFH